MQILLLSDNEKLIVKLKQYLTKNKNSYYISKTEETLFAIGNQDQYDEIICDGTFQQCQVMIEQIRASKVKLPLLAIVKDGSSADFSELLDLGADDCVSEQCENQEMMARIKALSRRSSNYKDLTLEFKDLQLDCRIYTLSCNNNIINLNRKEFQIMELLMSNQNMMFSPQMMMDKIWGDNDADMSVVWTYIGFLRRKIKKLNSQVNIKSARNLGYYLT